MEIQTATIKWKGSLVKVTDGKVFIEAFGTTGPNQKPHWTWIEVDKDSLKPELLYELKDCGLLK